MGDNFDYKRFLTENKLTNVSKQRALMMKEVTTVGPKGTFDWDNDKQFDPSDPYKTLPNWINTDKEFIAYVSYIIKYAEVPDQDDLKKYMESAKKGKISWAQIDSDYDSGRSWLKNLKDQWQNKNTFGHSRQTGAEDDDFELDKPRNANKIPKFKKKWKIWTDYLNALWEFPEEQDAARQRKTKDSKKIWNMLFGSNNNA